MQLSVPFYTFTRVDEKLIAEIELFLEVEYGESEEPSQYSPGDPGGVGTAIVDMVKTLDVFNAESGVSVSPEVKEKVHNLIQNNFVGKNVLDLPLIHDDGSEVDKRNIESEIQKRASDKMNEHEEGRAVDKYEDMQDRY